MSSKKLNLIDFGGGSSVEEQTVISHIALKYSLKEKIGLDLIHGSLMLVNGHTTYR